jgi:hypothetical protein
MSTTLVIIGAGAAAQCALGWRNRDPYPRWTWPFEPSTSEEVRQYQVGNACFFGGISLMSFVAAVLVAFD